MGPDNEPLFTEEQLQSLASTHQKIRQYISNYGKTQHSVDSIKMIEDVFQSQLLNHHITPSLVADLKIAVQSKPMVVNENMTIKQKRLANMQQFGSKETNNKVAKDYLKLYQDINMRFIKEIHADIHSRLSLIDQQRSLNHYKES